VFKEELLQEAYGGKLTILTEVGELLTKGRFPGREKN
jgi:manganese/zinc/iron transport system ATP- binding protein